MRARSKKYDLRLTDKNYVRPKPLGLKPQMAYLELSVIRDGQRYFVIVEDAQARHKVGPYDNRKAAKEMHDYLANKAFEMGGMPLRAAS